MEQIVWTLEARIAGSIWVPCCPKRKVTDWLTRIWEKVRESILNNSYQQFISASVIRISNSIRTHGDKKSERHLGSPKITWWWSHLRVIVPAGFPDLHTRCSESPMRGPKELYLPSDKARKWTTVHVTLMCIRISWIYCFFPFPGSTLYLVEHKSLCKCTFQI